MPSGASATKMATKNCPKCDSANPVACKKCACGHVFFTTRRSANALAVDYGEEISEPTTPQEPEVPRRRTARVTRERPQFYDALQVENQTRRQRELQKRRKASKSDDVDVSSEDIAEKPAVVASTKKRAESPPAKAAEPPAKKRRGRPPGLTNRRSARAQILATNKSSDANAKAAEYADNNAEDNLEASGNIHDVPAVKVLQMNLVLSDINSRISSSSVRAEENLPSELPKNADVKIKSESAAVAIKEETANDSKNVKPMKVEDAKSKDVDSGSETIITDKTKEATPVVEETGTSSEKKGVSSKMDVDVKEETESVKAVKMEVDDEKKETPRTDPDEMEVDINEETKTAIEKDDAKASKVIEKDDAKASKGIEKDDAKASKGIEKDDAKASKGIEKDDAKAATENEKDDAKVAKDNEKDDAKVAKNDEKDDTEAAKNDEKDDAKSAKNDDKDDTNTGRDGGKDDAKVAEKCVTETAVNPEKLDTQIANGGDNDDSKNDNIEKEEIKIAKVSEKEVTETASATEKEETVNDTDVPKKEVVVEKTSPKKGDEQVKQEAKVDGANCENIAPTPDEKVKEDGDVKPESADLKSEAAKPISSDVKHETTEEVAS